MANSILIQNGTIIDPAQGINGMANLRVSDGVVKEIGQNLQPQAGEEVIDAKGKYVIPGMIDLHVHCYGGIGVDLDSIGVYCGVTTVVDAGSAGPSTFLDLLALTEDAATSVYSIVFAEAPGAVDFMVHTKPEQLGSVHITKIANLIEKYPDKLRGFKSAALTDLGLPWVSMTKALSKWFGRPAYYHIGNFRRNSMRETNIRGMLAMLEKDDVITHCYTAEEGGLIDGNGNVYPELFEALDRGVHLDLGHGSTGFSFASARTLLEHGIKPHSISADNNTSNMKKLNMPIAISKVYALGIPLEEIVSMVTIQPARVIGIDDRAGTLKPGYPADVAIFDLADGPWELFDTEGEKIEAEKRFVPWKTFKNGVMFDADEERARLPENHRYRVEKEQVPVMAATLKNGQREYLSSLADLLQRTPDYVWDAEVMQSAIHSLATECELPLKEALHALYFSFGNNIANGPQLGWFLNKQNKSFVVNRLNEVAKLKEVVNG